MPRDSILVVRPAATLDGVIAPAVPPGWTDYQIESGGWITYWPRGRVERPRVFVHVRLVADGLASGRACFLFQGPTNIMDNIAASSFRSWAGCPAMRADGLAVAVNVRARWIDRERVGFITGRMAGYGDTDGESRTNEDE